MTNSEISHRVTSMARRRHARLAAPSGVTPMSTSLLERTFSAVCLAGMVQDGLLDSIERVKDLGEKRQRVKRHLLAARVCSIDGRQADRGT